MSKLYVIATPIGNLEDITLRALRVLKESEVVLCEDTRVTRKLLTHYGISTPVKRMDAHTEKNSVHRIEEIFTEYRSVALVSDAGTPTISDPGSRFVESARSMGVSVEVIPGPSALTAALSVSGLSAPEFVFLGFLPHKKGRETLFKEIQDSVRTTVFYESPHRIVKTLTQLAKILPRTRKVVVARELTKIYEEIISGDAHEVLLHFTENVEKQRGEFVVLISAEKRPA